MTDTLISFEVAKLAKEKGYNIQSTKFYKVINPLMTEEDLKISIQTSDFEANYNFRAYADLYSAPTQSLLQKWLREAHKIDIYCIPFEGEWHHNIASQNPPFLGTYEDSLEQALLQGLKLIK